LIVLLALAAAGCSGLASPAPSGKLLDSFAPTDWAQNNQG
jgi:hypothetical protein